MGFIKSYDTANFVIEDANERFAPLWKPNADKIKIFEEYCQAIDSLVDEFGGISLDVEVNEISMEITISLECEEIVVEKNNHVLYELIKRTIRYGYSVSEDGNLLIKFVFPGIWDKV